MPAVDIRPDIQSVIGSVTGVGGTGTLVDRKIHLYAYESDDNTEAATFWVPTAPTGTINGVMITRIGREDREKVAATEFAVLHRFRVIFRYGKKADPLAEKTFEDFLELILEAIRGSATIFKRDGLHPQPDAEQVAVTLIRNFKFNHTRTWEAEIEFTVVERVFESP